MKSLLDIIHENTNNIINCGIFSVILPDYSINEKNVKIFPLPKPGDEEKPHSKFSAVTGDHARERQSERHVSNKEIINALFEAWPDIKKLYKNKELSSEDTNSKFLIIDARKGVNKKTVCIVGRIEYNRNPNNLKSPVFKIITVFRGDDFAAAKRNDQNQCKIFLY